MRLSSGTHSLKMQLHEDFESIHSGGLILRCWKGFLATSTLESPKASHIVFHMYHRVTPTINLEFPKIHKYYLKRFVSTFSCEYDKNWTYWIYSHINSLEIIWFYNEVYTSKLGFTQYIHSFFFISIGPTSLFILSVAYKPLLIKQNEYNTVVLLIHYLSYQFQKVKKAASDNQLWKILSYNY